MRGACASFFLFVPLFATAQFRPGSSYQYRVVATQIEFEGSGSKITSQSVAETPIQIRVVDASNAEVTSGPLFTRGRSVGRSRVRNVRLGGSQVPAWFSIAPPASGLKPGQSWTAPLSAPAPIPAGLQANYVCRSNKNGVAIVDVSVKRQSTTTDLRATGNLALDSKTGIPNKGKITFLLSFVRPDMKDRSKMVVNSHMTLECVIKPK